MRRLGALLILATLFSGCVSATRKKELSKENAASSNAAVKIKAIVIKQLGEHANEVMQTEDLVCFLALKDPEYALIQKMLTMDKVRFEYDTEKEFIGNGPGSGSN
jgi:PBP1b-binding outer membrane lipoprotein LpoB